MESQRVDMFLMSHNKYFESYHLMEIKDLLTKADDSKFTNVQIQQYKDPTTVLIVSLLAGPLGIDRFMIGDTGLGIGKLLTCGGFGIWAIIDYFLIMGATKSKNFEKLVQSLSY
ncbi:MULTISPECIES: TM2 domain-containing protein [Sphingobacterium]|uniref:TM2 domain-containing protein n=2 Tax=Sphingobacterium hotanense TaxID=649196 RepID=A0ABT7NM29_9SPHI|nr:MULTISPECIES: TM2 domain-containing protein [Sphingobacterium]MDM1048311.1 TM2 domain-containing protein [Sphingobacterium hotanense]WKK58860.1 TM2 domain-containing protein [Sphingobacterium sp. BN32]